MSSITNVSDLPAIAKTTRFYRLYIATQHATACLQHRLNSQAVQAATESHPSPQHMRPFIPDDIIKNSKCYCSTRTHAHHRMQTCLTLLSIPPAEHLPTEAPKIRKGCPLLQSTTPASTGNHCFVISGYAGSVDGPGTAPAAGIPVTGVPCTAGSDGVYVYVYIGTGCPG